MEETPELVVVKQEVTLFEQVECSWAGMLVDGVVEAQGMLGLE